MSFENTVNYKDYRKYLEVKNNISFNYKGVDLIKVIAFEVLDFYINNSKLNIIYLLKTVFIKFDTKKLFQAFESYKTIFSTIYYSRKDHTELLNKVSENINNSIIVNLKFHKHSIKINLKVYLKVFHYLVKFNKFKDFNFIQKLCVFSRIIYFCNIIDELEKIEKKIDFHCKCYVPFLSSTGVEALLTLYFKNKGVKTFHIFHGLFGRYKLRIANDIINGDNINSDYILAFSELQRNDLIKDFNVEGNKIFIAGNPKYPSKKISVKNTFKKCIVLNGFGFYDDDFIKLIFILNNVNSKTGISFHIKPHPNSKITERQEITNCKNIEILPKEKLISNILKNSDYDFAISYNTVTYYEVMYYDLICLRFGLNENLDFYGLDDKFYDETSLIKLINEYKTKSLDDINKSIENLLRYAIGMGINNYTKYLT
jgi:hypothetical protein